MLDGTAGPEHTGELEHTGEQAGAGAACTAVVLPFAHAAEAGAAYNAAEAGAACTASAAAAAAGRRLLAEVDSRWKVGIP